MRIMEWAKELQTATEVSLDANLTEVKLTEGEFCFVFITKQQHEAYLGAEIRNCAHRAAECQARSSVKSCVCWA